MSYATGFQFQLLLNFVDVIDMLGNISVKQSLTNAHVIKKKTNNQITLKYVHSI